MLKLLVFDKGAGFDAGFVVIDGIDRIVEDVGDLFGVADAKPHQGKNPEIGVQQLVWQQFDVIFRGEKRIVGRHEIGEYFEKGFIEIDEQFFSLLTQVDIVHQYADVVETLGYYFIVDRAFKLVQLFDVFRDQVEIVTYVLLSPPAQ